MSKYLIFITIFLFMAMKSGNPQTNNNMTSKQVVVNPSSLPITQPPQSSSIPFYAKVEANILSGSPAQKQRLKVLTAATEQVINSEDFRSRVINAWYKGKAQFEWNKGKTNSQIYQEIMESAEMGGSKDFVWQLEIKLERSRCSTLGWTYPTTKSFSFNVACGNFDRRTDSGLVGTICHEHLHKLNYGHPARNTNWREYTVPYAVGNICAEIYKKMIKENL